MELLALLVVMIILASYMLAKQKRSIDISPRINRSHVSHRELLEEVKEETEARLEEEGRQAQYKEKIKKNIFFR